MNQKNNQHYSDNIVKSVFETIKESGMLSAGNRVLISISGGPDSTFLAIVLNMLKETYKLKLFAFHLDHMTRKGQSSRDAEFVAGLCKNLDIELFTSRIDVRQWCRHQKLSFQEGARKLRLQLLTLTAEKCNADRIATGHNADDNIETFLMNLARGAGLRGLSGIKPVRLKFIRPLIRISRSEILEYLQTRQIAYCTDKTNLENIYFRNKVRNILMPCLKKQFSGSFDKKLLESIEFIRQDNDLISALAEKEFGKAAFPESDPDTGEVYLVKILLTYLSKMHVSLAKRIIIKGIELIKGDAENIKSKNLRAILNISSAGGESRQVKLTENIISYKEGNFLYIFNKNIKGLISNLPDSLKPSVDDSETMSEIQPGVKKRIEELGIEVASEVIDKGILAIDYKSAGNMEAYLDFDKIDFPLRIKRWHPGSGDRFYPLGNAGTKKIHDFMIDLKIPKSTRINIPVFFDRSKIVWIGGFRIDERAKINSSTKKVLYIKIFKI